MIVLYAFLCLLPLLPWGGACINRHLTLGRSPGGPDAAFSLEPDEFKKMVKSVREAEKVLGEVSYDLTEKMKKVLNFPALYSW